MLPNYIRIQIDDYRADICLSALPEMPLLNFRKVCRLMMNPCNEFPQDIAVMEKYLQDATSAAEARWHEAAASYSTGWKNVPNKRSRKPEVQEVLRQNRELAEARSKARRRYEALQIRLNIFLERMNSK